MKVYRLSVEKFAWMLDGKGAARSNNRWNSKGVPMIYTAENRALAMAEVLVHLPMYLVPADYVMIEINIESELISTVYPEQLSSNWNTLAGQSQTRQIGDKFLSNQEYLCLKVPSAVVPGEFNVLINPFHPDIDRVQITALQPFPFDERLFKP